MTSIEHNTLSILMALAILQIGFLLAIFLRGLK